MKSVKQGRRTYRLLESHPTSGHTERHADNEPYQHNGQHSRERYCAAGAFGPDEQIEEKEGGEHDARDENGSQGNVAFPSFATKSFVGTGGDISTNEAEESVKEKNDSPQETSI